MQSDVNEILRKLDILRRCLEDYDDDFFSEAINKKAYAEVLKETIDLIKQNTIFIEGKPLGTVIQRGKNNNTIVNSGVMNIDLR